MGGSTRINSTRVPAKLSQIAKPSRTIGFTDSALSTNAITVNNTRRGYYSLSDAHTTASSNGQIVTCHGMLANVLWVDGHVTGERGKAHISRGFFGGDIAAMSPYTMPVFNKNNPDENYWDRK